ncbi:MBL fold metallo-hydrolase [Humisphaera borealis]|uniref:MBL fold metallo-hydrolase n=1 Tax=Humisphaera borealis TaxID=2807512 RepID=A0A7M2WR98_9BACT|nr:MBL fold metallo-hydrolase [Humisphaera borealis]QOV87672.1 MBL fold metallo-hydrolase [Humisphaera borealis]
MSLDLCILASGSAGNCSVVRSARGTLLIDAGLSPRATERRLAAIGVRLDRIAGVCLTHLDSDHLSASFLAWLCRNGVPIFCHHDKVDALGAIAGRRTIVLRNVQHFGEDGFEPLDGLNVEAIPVHHDAEGSHAFVLEATESRSSAVRIGFATDLGRVPHLLIDRFCDNGGLDILAIESNYCPQMQASSSRPEFLKRRITGGHGHLSNQQAFDAVKRILDRQLAQGNGLPGSVALLHRSQECNCPTKVREMFSRDVRIAKRLVLAEQTESTGWLARRVARIEQMLLWG